MNFFFCFFQTTVMVKMDQHAQMECALIINVTVMMVLVAAIAKRPTKTSVNIDRVMCLRIVRIR